MLYYLNEPTAVPPDINFIKKKNIDIYTLSLTPVASTVWDLNLLWQEKGFHAEAYNKIVLMP
jgi:hypothetical protein